MDIKDKIQNLVKDSLGKLHIDFSSVEIVVDIPKDIVNGHYSTNVSMRLSSRLKDSPMSIANKIVGSISNDIDIDRVETASPGFINFFLSNRYFMKEISQIIDRGEDGLYLPTKKDQSILVEFTDANPFKVLHIGHLYSNSVGESFARLQEALGAKVIRACYQGDIGLHVAKSIWGLEKKLSCEKRKFQDLERLPLTERVAYLGDSYALGSSHYDDIKDEDAIRGVNDLNFYLFSLFSETMEKKDFSKFEKDNIKEKYTKGRQWCLDYFETIYAKLGTKFDNYFFESEVGESGLKIVLSNLGMIFQEDGGAIIYRGDESKNLHTRVFVNSKGIPTYEAKELGLALEKSSLLKFDESVVITADEQSGYFKVVMDALNKIDKEIADKTKHFAHGKVKLPGSKKMSSRKGSILSAEWLISETQQRVKEIMQKNKSSEYVGIEEASEKIAIGAIKYAFLKVSIGRDIVFDFDKSVSFDGDTGPYIMYVYSRCLSILKGANLKEIKNICFDSCLENAYTKELVLALSKYEESLLDSATSYSPSTLCQYLFDLSQVFNSFYQNVRVLDSSEEERQILLLVVKATSLIVKDGLNRLGIGTVEKM